MRFQGVPFNPHSALQRKNSDLEKLDKKLKKERDKVEKLLKELRKEYFETSEQSRYKLKGINKKLKLFGIKEVNLVETKTSCAECGI